MPYLKMPNGRKSRLTAAQQASFAHVDAMARAEIARLETSRRNAIALAAFYGAFPDLGAHLADTHGYTENGRYYPANGATLADYRAWVQDLAADVLAALCGEAEA